MNDSILNYWIEAVETALEDIDKLSIFSTNDIEALAKNILGYAEQESMAFGRECIPNPLQTEMHNLKAQHKKEIDTFERREFIFRKNVSDRHGPYIGPENVHIDGNDVVYDAKGLG